MDFSRNRCRKKKKAKLTNPPVIETKHKHQTSITTLSPFKFYSKPFLPHHTITHQIQRIPYNSYYRKTIILHYRDWVRKHRVALHSLDISGSFIPPAGTSYFEMELKAMEVADAQEKDIRRRLGRFVALYKLHRMRHRPLNTDDPATLSPPRTPIVLHDWTAKGVWCFEAASLRDHISAELSHVSYGFPKSLSPRNPLTNLPFTYGQLLSVRRQLCAVGKTNSIIEGFYELNFKVGVYQSVYWKAIQLRAFERSYADERGDEFREKFREFFTELVYALIKIDMRAQIDELFHWAVGRAVSMPYIQEWKGIYRQYQLTEILYKEDPCYGRMHASIHGEARILFTRKRELDELRQLKLEMESSGGEEDADDESLSDYEAYANLDAASAFSPS
jgi:hypothetical protein